MSFFVPIIGLILYTATSCLSIQFPPVTRDHYTENINPEPERQSRAINNYIVTSRPYQLINYTEPTTNPKWRRELYVSTTLGASNYEPSGSSFSNDCGPNSQSCPNYIKQDDSPTFRPYSQADLDKILKEYTKEKNHTDIHSKLSNAIITHDDLYSTASTVLSSATTSAIDSVLQDKSKSWNHVTTPQKNSYDDRQGWVTLEPVAWSSSQVQKWEPNPNRPTWPVPSEITQWNGPSQTTPHYPEHSSWPTDRPWKQPTYQYGASPSARPPVQSHYVSSPVSTGHLHFANSKPEVFGPPHGWGGGSNNPDIITDGRPEYFPSDRPTQSNKPWESIQSPYGIPKPHTQVVYQGPISAHEKPSYPSEGEGHWVLLSSTKGYSVPQRHRNMARSIRLDAVTEVKDQKPKKQISSHRSVRLTVLPPLNDTDTQITHGGMLEVEKTHQTVDEAHREHLARSMKFSSHPTGNSTIERVMKDPKTRFARKSSSAPETSTRDMALAAVGAGVIPATMAMILPVILARKKRSNRSNLVKTLQRYNARTVPMTPEYQIFRAVSQRKNGRQLKSH